MKDLLRKSILPVLHSIRRIIAVIQNHAIPRTHPDRDVGFAYRQYREDGMRDSYNHFKKYFDDALFIPKDQIRNYAIREAISNHQPDYYYLEFGVWNGASLNYFSKVLKDTAKTRIYGFDSFEGLKEDWKGSVIPKGHFNLNKQIPKLNDNCVPVMGWIQDTLPKFISENLDLRINFVHIDTDTYPTAKFILKQIKPYLLNDAIIIFDELYNYAGWHVGEYKALIEEFNEEEFRFSAFSFGTQAVIQVKIEVDPGSETAA